MAAPSKLTPQMLVERVTVFDVDTLRLLEANPNQGDVGAVHQSMEEFGQVDTILVVDGTVVDGNHRVVAERQARRFGGKLAGIDATGLDLSDVRAMAMGLALNRTARLGHDDLELLSRALLAIQAEDDALLHAAGWSLDDLDRVLADITPTGTSGGGIHGDPDDVPDNAPAITKPGDLWLLGPHRLLCGDCRNPDDVARLLNGAKIQLGFTSPPYADRRKYDESSPFRPVPPDEYVAWFEPVAANVAAHLADDGSWFVNIKEHADEGQRVLYVKDLTLAHVREWGWRFVDEFCWDRGGVPGKWDNRFKNAWEPVFHFCRQAKIKLRHDAVSYESDSVFKSAPDNPKSKSGSGLLGTLPADRYGVGQALPSNVLRIKTGGSETLADHTAAFPVALPQWFIKAFTDSGDTVYDPFMGSGSTLIAAHSEGRTAVGTEISAGYCDVICRRYQRATGTQPVLEATGQPQDFDLDD